MVNKAFLLVHACIVAYASCADLTHVMPQPLRHFHAAIWQERFDYARQIREQNVHQTLQQLVHDEKLQHMRAQQTAYIHVGGWQLARSINSSLSAALLPTDLITGLVDKELPSTVDALSAKLRVSPKQLLEQDTHFEQVVAGMMLTLKYIHLLRSPSELGLQATIDTWHMHAHGMTIADAFLAALQTEQPILTIHEHDENLDNSWQALCAMDSFLYVYAERKRRLQLQHMSSSCSVL